MNDRIALVSYSSSLVCTRLSFVFDLSLLICTSLSFVFTRLHSSLICLHSSYHSFVILVTTLKNNDHMITANYVNIMIKASTLLQKYYSLLVTLIAYISLLLLKENENRILQGRVGFGKWNIIIQQRPVCSMRRFNNCFLL